MEIDQSGRVEDLTMNTVVAFANDHEASVFISAGTKREVVRFLKTKISPTDYAPVFFSILIFFLIKDEKFSSVFIDEEYTGKDEFISEKVRKLCKFFKKPCPQIVFGRIGKHSQAHAIAIRTHRSRGKGAIKVSLKNVMVFFLKKTAGTNRHTHRVSR